MSSINKNLQLTFSGCGFLGIYHLGVVDCLRSYIPNLRERVDKIYGCSAGCLVGMMVLCDKQMSDCLGIVKEVVVELSEIWGGPLNHSVNFSDALRKNLDSLLPPNAHEIATDKLFISCTKFPYSNEIISKFDSKEELISAMIASSYVPGYAGWKFPEYRGEFYYDGGLSNNLPRGKEPNISVAPFCGEIDICPEPSKFAFTKMQLAGHTLEISFTNIWRIISALFPMSSEKLDQLFKEGKEDCHKFIESHPELLKSDVTPKECKYPEDLTPQEETGSFPTIRKGYQNISDTTHTSIVETIHVWKNWYTLQLWETLYEPKKKVSGITSYLTGKVSESLGIIYKLTSRTTKTN